MIPQDIGTIVIPIFQVIKHESVLAKVVSPSPKSCSASPPCFYRDV